jgi:hypothetical protein
MTVCWLQALRCALGWHLWWRPRRAEPYRCRACGQTAPKWWSR